MCTGMVPRGAGTVAVAVLSEEEEDCSRAWMKKERQVVLVEEPGKMAGWSHEVR